MLFDQSISTILQKTKNVSTKTIYSILEKAKKNAFLNTHAEYIENLSEEEISILLNIDTSDQLTLQKLYDTALNIKKAIYGNRIVVFAPLYVSNLCQSSCLYCGYREKNHSLTRKALNEKDLIEEVKALQKQGHKRLLMLMGDHPDYPFEKFLEAVEIASNVKTSPHGEIRRINVEIPSLTFDQFKKLKSLNCVGTYALFQETYHKPTYEKMHPKGPKSDYNYRLQTMDRALSAGMDDVGIGVLFGLYDYRFEVLSLLRHANYLDRTYGIGPHTVSIPRMQKASNAPCANHPPFPVSDEDFKKLVAIIRCALPYTGIILSTREPPSIRRELYQIGVSQISAGSKTTPGGYQNKNKKAEEQFSLSDERPTSEVIHELVELGYIPSWCTACYRLNRTGKAFMDQAKTGSIHQCCQPNALLTFAEYLLDYAPENTQKLGWNLIEKHSTKLKDNKILAKRLQEIKNGKRDLYF